MTDFFDQNTFHSHPGIFAENIRAPFPVVVGLKHQNKKRDILNESCCSGDTGSVAGMTDFFDRNTFHSHPGIFAENIRDPLLCYRGSKRQNKKRDVFHKSRSSGDTGLEAGMTVLFIGVFFHFLYSVPNTSAILPAISWPPLSLSQVTDITHQRLPSFTNWKVLIPFE